MLLPVFLNSDARILYLNTIHSGRIRGGGLPDANDDLAFVSKLDGVADQIKQYLAHSYDIAVQVCMHMRRQVADELEFFAVSALCKKIQAILEHTTKIEWSRFERQLAGLDLREIEYVVDDR